MADAVVTPLGGGAFRVVEGESARVAYAAGPPDARWVFLDGRVYVLDGTPGTRRRVKRRPEHAALAAPMPATVASIAVEPGQAVAKGDVLVVLEAMKMELPIKSPRDGTIKSLACRPGELVQPGVPLLELE